ncbi:MAG: glycosyltransferase [Gammaproteobacteria bacterium]|nr:glycosyltransferase [Gammaproteobacteria bacterium]
MSSSDHPLVVVTPIYEDVDASAQLFRELARIHGDDVYVVAVDDGSVKQPVNPDAMDEAGIRGVVIRLRRNVGHQRAIAVGLSYVCDHLPNCEPVVVMDCDGEDLPESINRLTGRLGELDVDVVVAQRGNRSESFRFKAFYSLYRWMFGLLTGRKIRFGNFMALTQPAVQRLVAMQELWIHIAGCLIRSRLRIAACPLDRGARYVGQSKMNFVGLALHGFRAVMVFAEDVLVRVGIACAIVATASVVGALAAIALKLIGFATPGWFSIALGILLLMFLQTGALTLMTLMLTGVVGGGSVNSIAYKAFIDEVLRVGSDADR